MPNKGEIQLRTKAIVMSLPRYIHFDRSKNYTIIKLIKSKCNPLVIIVLQYRSICLSIRDSKIEGLPIKILGQAPGGGTSIHYL